MATADSAHRPFANFAGGLNHAPRSLSGSAPIWMPSALLLKSAMTPSNGLHPADTMFPAAQQ